MSAKTYEQALAEMTPLPERCCGHCMNWTRENPADLTAPEGKCNVPEPCAQFWPNTLQRDLCGSFESREQFLQGERIAEEERRDEILNNGQFGVGA